MRILVEPSEHGHSFNLGDITMQRTALERLRGLWPESEIRVFADEPELFVTPDSKIMPFATVGRTAWMSGHLPRLHHHLNLSYSLDQLMLKAERRSLEVLPTSTRTAVSHFLEAYDKSDLLVVCGMGGITNVFLPFAPNLLESIDLAASGGKAVVLFGQGVDPLDDNPKLKRRAAEVLRKVDIIAVREGLTSPRVLRGLGVSADKIRVTGDDAIEFASSCKEGDHQAIGVNLRVARYSKVGQQILPALRSEVHRFAFDREATLIPVPSDLHPINGDRAIIKSILDGYAKCEPDIVEDPQSLTQQLAKCRVLLTGSYHAGVFALSQGVPIVCIENSDYYKYKWEGLRHQFGGGVSIVTLSNPRWRELLGAELEKAWKSFGHVHAILRKRAAGQVHEGRQAYQSAKAIVESKLRNQ
jgi:polysaccharide pyruvyl transferase WcaK-like protein